MASSSESDSELDTHRNERSAHGHGGPFSESARQTLLSLYKKGMTGWGKKKQPFLEIAKQDTGLTEQQIQVLKFRHCLVLY